MSMEREGGREVSYVGWRVGLVRGLRGGGGEGSAPLYSRKLHMRVRRASTSCVTSRTILDFSFGLRVVNHFERRCVVEISGSCHKHVRAYNM